MEVSGNLKICGCKHISADVFKFNQYYIFNFITNYPNFFCECCHYSKCHLKCLNSNNSSIIFFVSLLIIADVNKGGIASKKKIVWIKPINYLGGAPANFSVLYAHSCSVGHPVFMMFSTQVYLFTPQESMQVDF